MTDYKSIKGQKVQNFTTDPENPVVDQVWYNETSGDLEIRKTSLGSAWATGGDLNTARSSFGGATPTATATTETWNGSSWTEVNDLNTTRVNLAFSGLTNTAALAFGGNP